MEKDFYSDISSQYDNVFKANAAQVNFINSFVNNDTSNLVEIGCGTGSLALMLKNNFTNISAIDINPEMISKAKEKDVSNDIEFEVLGMLDIEEKYKSNTQDIISCIGNTLVHLDNIEQVEAFIKSCYTILKDDSHLLIQIVNYDRVIDQGVEELPLIDNDQITFERKYTLKGDKVKFDTNLFSKEENKTYVNSIDLLALRKSKLESILVSQGFKDVTFYSNFKKDEWKSNSMPTIVSCKK